MLGGLTMQQQQQYFNETWQTHETQYKVEKNEKQITQLQISYSVYVPKIIKIGWE